MSGRCTRLAVWLLAIVLMVTGTACSQPAMTKADARTFASKALTHIGFTNVQVDTDVSLASYSSPDPKYKNRKPVQVWRTRTTVAEGTVELYVPRKGNSAVFVRDEATTGGALLTDRQFRLLQDFRLNPAADRRRSRLQGPTIAAVVLAVLVACGLFVAVIFGRTPGIRPGGGGDGGEPEETPQAAEEPRRQPQPIV
jgi:hypothetical protein